MIYVLWYPQYFIPISVTRGTTQAKAILSLYTLITAESKMRIWIAALQGCMT